MFVQEQYFFAEYLSNTNIGLISRWISYLFDTRWVAATTASSEFETLNGIFLQPGDFKTLSRPLIVRSVIALVHASVLLTTINIGTSRAIQRPRCSRDVPTATHTNTIISQLLRGCYHARRKQICVGGGGGTSKKEHFFGGRHYLLNKLLLVGLCFHKRGGGLDFKCTFKRFNYLIDRAYRPNGHMWTTWKNTL
jgi:hypothetical protein